MTKAHVTAAFLLGGSLIGGNALAAEPLVEIIHAGASVGTYANFDAGMKAAAPGDVEVHATNVVFKTCGFAADSGGQTLRGSKTCGFAADSGGQTLRGSARRVRGRSFL